MSLQVAQLEAAGFTDVRIYDQAGEETDVSPHSSWMHYACRRA